MFSSKFEKNIYEAIRKTDKGKVQLRSNSSVVANLVISSAAYWLGNKTTRGILLFDGTLVDCSMRMPWSYYRITWLRVIKPWM